MRVVFVLHGGSVATSGFHKVGYVKGSKVLCINVSSGSPTFLLAPVSPLIFNSDAENCCLCLF